MLVNYEDTSSSLSELRFLPDLSSGIGARLLRSNRGAPKRATVAVGQRLLLRSGMMLIDNLLRQVQPLMTRIGLCYRPLFREVHQHIFA